MRHQGTADLILLENKLSGSTANTIRQNQGFKIIGNGGSLEVKAPATSKVLNGNGEIVNGAKLLEKGPGNSLRINRNKVYKNSDAGNKEGNFDINSIIK